MGATPIAAPTWMSICSRNATRSNATFFSILQAWSHDNYGKSRTSQDFADLASTISGQDLTKFFDDWLYATQVPDTYPS